MVDYVTVSNGEEGEAALTVELPTEEDGTLLLSVLQSQFEGATGLKYKNPDSGSWRGVRISDGILRAPPDGWGGNTTFVVVGSVKEKKEREQERGDRESSRESGGMAGQKRSHYDDHYYSSNSSKNPRRSPSPSSYPRYQHSASSGDLIVLGLRYDIDEQELREYFQHYGEVDQVEIKRDHKTKQSRGFGFLRFKDPSIQDRVMAMTHTIKGRRCELRPPRKSPNNLPCKFFIGCLPNDPEITVEELKAYFSQYGVLSDVYIPKPYRGFGFVTYLDGFDAQRMSKAVHTIRGHRLNVSVAEPKMGTKSSPRDVDYRSSSVSAYQTTPAQVYAYSLLQQPNSTHATAYVPATQYYAYQADSSGRPQQYTTGGHQQHYSSYQTTNNRLYK